MEQRQPMVSIAMVMQWAEARGVWDSDASTLLPDEDESDKLNG